MTTIIIISLRSMSAFYIIQVLESQRPICPYPHETPSLANRNMGGKTVTLNLVAVVNWNKYSFARRRRHHDS